MDLLRNQIITAILTSLNAYDGAGSDLSVGEYDHKTGYLMDVHGNIDVQHLTDDILRTMGK